MTPLVAAAGAGRTYGSGGRAAVALHGASCTVAPGDAVAVVGPSGSGKTTLLHLLAGLDAPTTGRVSWPALGDHPRRLRPGTIGVVFQGPSLLPALDVAQNVALPLLLAGETETAAARAAADALHALVLGPLAPRLPEELSGGQIQRVAVARALAAGPRLLIADEPTGQLDHTSAGTVLDAIEAACRATGAAVVLATHDPLIAERMPIRWEVDDGALRTTVPACSP